MDMAAEVVELAQLAELVVAEEHPEDQEELEDCLLVLPLIIFMEAEAVAEEERHQEEMEETLQQRYPVVRVLVLRPSEMEEALRAEKAEKAAVGEVPLVMQAGQEHLVLEEALGNQVKLDKLAKME
jgi:hypothetical protein